MKRDIGWVWQALGVAAGSTCISTGGPSIQGNGRWGQVLKVEDAYRLSSHAFIRPLFSGVQGNGNSDGRGGGAWRWGHEHAVPYCGDGMLQPSLMEHVAFVVGSLCDASCWPG